MADGVLVLAGTPIGDDRQASPALRAALVEADLIAAEDTRRLRALGQRLGLELTAPLISYFDGNEASRTPDLLAALQAGQRVVLVTDAGMPAISDPGTRLVRAAVAAGVPVTTVPGPSAVLAALAVSGLPTDRFCFEGFPPRQAGPRGAQLRRLAAEERTLVFFEAPHRLAAFLAAARDLFGADRPAAICRELTKTHEEVVRGPLAELADWATGPVRGEIVVVIQGARPGGASVTEAELVAEVGQLTAAGTKLSAAVAEVASRHRADRKTLYAAVTRLRTPRATTAGPRPATGDGAPVTD